MKENTPRADRVTYRPEKLIYPVLDQCVQAATRALARVQLPPFHTMLAFYGLADPHKLSWVFEQGLITVENTPQNSSNKIEPVLDAVNSALVPLVGLPEDAPKYTRIKLLNGALYGMVLTDILTTKSDESRTSFLEDLGGLVAHPESVPELVRKRELELLLHGSTREAIKKRSLGDPVLDAASHLFEVRRMKWFADAYQYGDRHEQQRLIVLSMLHSLMHVYDPDAKGIQVTRGGRDLFLFPSASVRLQDGLSTGVQVPKMIVDSAKQQIIDAMRQRKAHPNQDVAYEIATEIKARVGIMDANVITSLQQRAILEAIEDEACGIARCSHPMATELMGIQLSDFGPIVDTLPRKKNWHKRYVVLKRNESDGKVVASFRDEDGIPIYMELTPKNPPLEPAAIVRCPAGNMLAGSNDFNDRRGPQKQSLEVQDMTVYSSGMAIYHTIVEALHAQSRYARAHPNIRYTSL